MTTDFVKLILLFLLLGQMAHGEATRPPASGGETELGSCEQYFQDNRCEDVIERAGTSIGYLDCSETTTDKVVSCVGAASAGFAISSVLPSSLIKASGRVFLPLFIFHVGANIADRLTRSQQECFENGPYKWALLTPVIAYHGEDFASRYMNKDCHFVESYVRDFVERTNYQIDQKKAEQERYSRFLELNQGREYNERLLERRFPKDKRELTEQEIGFLQNKDAFDQAQLEILKKAKKFAEENPCRSLSFYTNAFCGFAGGIAGAIRKKAVVATAASMAHVTKFGTPGVQTSDLGYYTNMLGKELARHMRGTRPGLKVSASTKAKIQGLKQKLLDYANARGGVPVCFTGNNCTGSPGQLKTILHRDLGIDSSVVTFDPKKYGLEGVKYSFLIVPNYFGEDSPLIIDPTIKRLLPDNLRDSVHDFFVGSPDELLSFMMRYQGGSDPGTVEESFQRYMRAYGIGGKELLY